MGEDLSDFGMVFVIYCFVIAEISSPLVLSRFLIHLRLAPGDAKTRPSGSYS